MKNEKTIPNKRNTGNAAQTDFPTFRQRLEDLRRDRKMNITQAAAFLGVSRKTYHLWENGTAHGTETAYTMPSIENIVSIANKYSVSVDYILGLSDFTAPENEYINNITGLTDNAAVVMRDIGCHPYFPLVISALLENRNLKYFLSLLQSRFSCPDSFDDITALTIRGQSATVKTNGLLDSIFSTHLLQDLPDLAASYMRILDERKEKYMHSDNNSQV